MAPGHSSFETDSSESASALKRSLRMWKKSFDLRGDSGYKTHLSAKVRVIIEGEELYTLLLDHLFEEEYLRAYSGGAS